MSQTQLELKTETEYGSSESANTGKKRKKRRGDRKDGWLVRDMDALHAICPYLLPNRADSEGVLNETVDMTEVIKYIDKKNEDNPEFKYTFFHFICAALAKTMVLRPKMNRFYSGHRLYDRKELIFSFVVKKQFSDSGEEVLSTVKVEPESDIPPLEQIYQAVKKIVYSVRKRGESDSTTDKMNILLKLPRPVLRLAFKFLGWLEYHGKYPSSLMKDDPYYSSVFLSNLGSIKMSADYHHLTNWGTNSVFMIIGEKKPMPFYGADGSVTVKEAINISLTVDERIADGFYFANSIKIFRKIMQNPYLIERPISEPIEY